MEPQTTINVLTGIAVFLILLSGYLYDLCRVKVKRIKVLEGLLKSEEDHRRKLEIDLTKSNIRFEKLEKEVKDNLENQAREINRVEAKLKSKLKFAINNTPVFNVGEVVKSIEIVSIDVETKSSAGVIFKSALACLFGGIGFGIKTFSEEREKQASFVYEVKSAEGYLGLTTKKHWSEEQIIELKKSKAKK